MQRSCQNACQTVIKKVWISFHKALKRNQCNVTAANSKGYCFKNFILTEWIRAFLIAAKVSYLKNDSLIRNQLL